MFSIFRDDDWFFSACLVLLTAEEDACNEEGGGSGEGGWRDDKSIFTLSEKCSPEGEEEEDFNNFKK